MVNKHIIICPLRDDSGADKEHDYKNNTVRLTSVSMEQINSAEDPPYPEDNCTGLGTVREDPPEIKRT